MLVVRVELWPGGLGPGVEIGRAAIANVGDGTVDGSSYLVIGADDSGRVIGRVVRRHWRHQGFWPLLAKAFAPGLSSQLPVRWRRTADLMAGVAGIDGFDVRTGEEVDINGETSDPYERQD